jgi:paired amphipathic helix protein Sin3a
MEISVRLFKKDEPTFEFNQVDKIKRWRGYVASYMTVEPTEELDYTRLRYPYLKDCITKQDNPHEDDPFDKVTGQDKIVVQVTPEFYVMKFMATDPHGIGGVQYFIQPEGGSGSSETAAKPDEEQHPQKSAKKDVASEKFIHNNAWIKDSGHDDVEASKASFTELKDSPKKVEEGAQDEDVDMMDS